MKKHMVEKLERNCDNMHLKTIMKKVIAITEDLKTIYPDGSQDPYFNAREYNGKFKQHHCFMETK